jgi:LPXTG-motif cell wall-anchored protein
VLAVFGAAAIGTLAAVAIPSAANAHTLDVTGTAGCADGNPIVTWTVKTGYVPKGVTGKVLSDGYVLTPAGSTITTIQPNATIARNASLSGVQTITGTGTTATLKLTVKWTDGFKQVKQGGPVTLRTDCKPAPTPKPHASAAALCDDSVVVTITNDADATAAAVFVVTGSGGFSETKTVASGGTDTVTIPADKATGISVTANGTALELGTPTPAANCAAPVVNSTPACDSLTIDVANPTDGRAVTVTLIPSDASAGSIVPAAYVVPASVTFALKPGEQKSTPFTASEGLNVKIQITGLADQTVTWNKDASCAAASTPTPAATPELPTTGSSLTLPITIGAVLVVAGTALLFVYRRRRGATN